jgi:hypothetical protein
MLDPRQLLAVLLRHYGSSKRGFCALASDPASAATFQRLGFLFGTATRASQHVGIINPAHAAQFDALVPPARLSANPSQDVLERFRSHARDILAVETAYNEPSANLTPSAARVQLRRGRARSLDLGHRDSSPASEASSPGEHI